MIRISQFKINVFLIIGSIALLLFTLESVTIAQNVHRVGNFDFYTIQAIQNHISPFNTSLMISATQLGSPVIMVLFSVLLQLLLLKNKKYELAIWSLATFVIGAVIINPFLKILIARPRPTFHRIVHESGYSYPSGHVIAATLFYGMLAIMAIFYFKKIYTQIAVIFIAGILVTLVMVSRIYLGVHYPSDVIAGVLLGIAIDFFSAGIFAVNSAALYRFFQRYSKNRDHQENNRHLNA